VNSNPHKLFIFGDNTQRKGTGGQAEIRYATNVSGIVTKILPSYDEAAFWSDDSFDTFKHYVNRDIEKILNSDYKIVVFPEDGLGTGRAQLKHRAPKCWEYLCFVLLVTFGYNNASGQVR
jgi:hypothetical protein